MNIDKFYNNQCPDNLNVVFCPVGDNRVAALCCNKKNEIAFS